MNESGSRCQSIKVIEALIEKERELREALESKLEERDRRYEERFQSQEKFNAIVSSNAKEAVAKAEISQTVYNATHNDLTRKMDAQYKEMLPRTEADSRFKSQEEKINDLREFRSGLGGADRNKSAVWAVVLVLIGWGLTIALFLFKK